MPLFLNHLTGKADLHEKEGHTYFQVISGAIIGILTGYILYNFSEVVILT